MTSKAACRAGTPEYGGDRLPKPVPQRDLEAEGRHLRAAQFVYGIVEYWFQRIGIFPVQYRNLGVRLTVLPQGALDDSETTARIETISAGPWLYSVVWPSLSGLPLSGRGSIVAFARALPQIYPQDYRSMVNAARHEKNNQDESDSR